MNVYDPYRPPAPPRRFPHVLIVEDERATASLIRAVVLRHGHGCSATLLDDGAELIQYFRGEGAYADREIYPIPDLVILDLGLPHMSGYDVLSWLDDHVTGADTPVVVFSGTADPSAAQRAFALGARAFLPKSADPTALAEVVRDMLARWTPVRRYGTLG